MRSWYDLTKEEKQNLKNEYSTKNNDNGKIIVLNILKVMSNNTWIENFPNIIIESINSVWLCLTMAKIRETSI